jgi:hypothetical protein
MEASRRLSAGEDATTNYKTAMYKYTVCSRVISRVLSR